MLNMIKYELYRYSRNLSTYVTFTLLIIFNIMMVGMNASEPGAQTGEHALSTFMSITDFATFAFVSTGFTMIYGAWVGVYAYGEFGKGYIRNIASVSRSKIQFFVAHMAVCAVMFVIMAVISSVSAMTAAKLMIANVKFGDIIHLLQVLSMELYLHLPLAALILFVTYISRNAFVPVIVSFCLPMGLETLPLITVQNFFTKIMGEGAKEINHWLDHTSVCMNVMMIELDLYNGDSLHKYFIVSGIMLVLYSVFACLSITKKDIK